jgi:hypothetical protein
MLHQDCTLWWVISERCTAIVQLQHNQGGNEADSDPQGDESAIDGEAGSSRQ